MPQLFPARPQAGDMFAASEELAQVTAMRNSTLQGAYLMMAARAMGFDVGPMSGFDNGAVDAEVFPDGQVRSNFICSIGRGDATALWPKLPRLEFDEACEIL